MDKDVSVASVVRVESPEPNLGHPTIVAELAPKLRKVYDPVLNKALPIYFGPVLGELFLVDR